MRLAWFAPSNVDGPTDTPHLIRALGLRHQIDVIDARAAHDFVWQHARRPYDMCVYELDNTSAHQYVLPYLVHYPGITRLHCVTLQASRAGTLERERRFDDFAREFAFAHPGVTPPMVRAWGLVAPGSWPMLAVPLLSSRLTVVAHAAVAEALTADYPGVRIRSVFPGVEPLVDGGDDTVVSLKWPVAGAPLIDAHAGFAAGRPVIVFDCPETADWPSINPQDWQPRSAAEPICIAIDPRDADHSLRLASGRLARDADLRLRLGTAARAWWRAHATVEQAAARFEEVLEEARNCSPPPRPDGWPAHMSEDGFARARAVLNAIGVELPF